MERTISSSEYSTSKLSENSNCSALAVSVPQISSMIGVKHNKTLLCWLARSGRHVVLCPELDAGTNASPSPLLFLKQGAASGVHAHVPASAHEPQRYLTVDGVVPSTLSIVAA